MAKKFDFNQIGKEMPYSVPQGFFNELENSISARLQIPSAESRPKRPSAVRILFRGLTAAAAVAAILATTHALWPNRQQQPSMTLEQAFANLDISDQEYLLDTYSDVSYISDQL